MLRTDGTLWLNLGDSYANDSKRGGSTGGRHAKQLHGDSTRRVKRRTVFKPKELMMIPARVALALQEDGWYLRSDIVWSKGNPMPESVKDRPTRSHEYVFLLAKSSSYFYDADAIREPHKGIVRHNHDGVRDRLPKSRVPGQVTQNDRAGNHPLGRNKRSVWAINPRPYKGAHFAVMPEELASLCIRAGSAPGDIVLDPFAGSGTTLGTAFALGRDYLGIELNLEFLTLIEQRLQRARELRSEHETFEFAMGRATQKGVGPSV